MEGTNFASRGTSTEKSPLSASIIMVFIFFVVLVSWGGMKWYLRTLDSASAQSNMEFDQVSKDLSGSRVDRLVAVGTRLSLLQEQLNDTNRVESAVFFSQLEKLTIPEVRISKYEVDMKKRSLVVTGVTDNFKYIAQQMNQFKRDDFFKGVTAGTFTRDGKGMITFSFNATF